VRILTALSYYHPYWTGLTTIARAIAEGLAARGHTVTVVTSRHESGLPLRDRIAGVDVVRVPALWRVSRGMVAPALPLQVASLLRRHDVLQLHTPMPEAPILALTARAMGRAVVMTHQGDLVMPPGTANRIVERAGTALLTGAGRIADRITTHSDDYAGHSAFLLPLREKIVTIRPPVTLPEPDLSAAERWREELGLGGRPLVGFAGRFVHEKGFDRLLAAIPELVELEPRVQLVYAGAAMPYERAFYEHCRPLLELHADRITQVGLLTDRARLASFYAMCDVIAVPSRTDCFPILQLEALRCGTPLVTADIPGAREAVTATGMGRLADASDPGALATAIAAVLHDRATYTRPRDEVRRLLDPDAAVDAYEALLQDLL
jgi:glycosyltransferase involved in cell wall biosynthesis